MTWNDSRHLNAASAMLSAASRSHLRARQKRSSRATYSKEKEKKSQEKGRSISDRKQRRISRTIVLDFLQVIVGYEAGIIGRFRLLPQSGLQPPQGPLLLLAQIIHVATHFGAAPSECSLSLMALFTVAPPTPHSDRPAINKSGPCPRGCGNIHVDTVVVSRLRSRPPCRAVILAR